MTEDRLNLLERRIDFLQEDHAKHETALDTIATNVQAILQQINLMAAGLAAHTTTEADHHSARSRLLSRIFLSFGAITALLTAIYAAVTGTSMQAALIPMLKSLFGL